MMIPHAKSLRRFNVFNPWVSPFFLSAQILCNRFNFVKLFFFQINGFSLDRVTHNEAVQHFVNAGETVTLKVIQGAEDAILVSI